MSFLDKLERALGRFAIPNISLYIVIAQVFTLLTSMFQLLDLRKIALFPALVLQGEWWRVFTFIAVPPPVGSDWGVIFIAFGWYLFYLMGNALEQQWGTFRYNIYLLVSIVLSIAAGFLTPVVPVSNLFVASSVFLAFAYLYPDFQMMLFFILPVKIKWLALITWVLYAYNFVMGYWSTRLQIAASVSSFFLFFSADILRGMRHRQRTMAKRAERLATEEEPRHVCHVCGRTDRSHPQLDFRYCSKCAGDQCYCPDHIQNHTHVVAADDAKSR